MRKLILVLGGSMVLTAAPLATADILGAGASVSYWQPGLSGDIASGNNSYDVEDDLDLDTDGSVSLEALVEHPVPVLPNVRLGYTLIEQDGKGTVTYNGATGRSEFDLEQLDLTLYYEILDNWVNIDLGLTVRDLSAELLVIDQNNSANQEKIDVSGALPMGYVAARFDLPFTGVSAGVQGNVISFDGDSIRDVDAYGQYEISVVQLRLGYRQIAVDYEDSNNLLDVTLGGPYASVGVDF